MIVVNTLAEGARIQLTGGYLDQEWLGGTDGKGTVLELQQVPGKRLPVVWVELDQEISAYGGKFVGSFAALNLHFSGDTWETPEVTVWVYLFKTLPQSPDWFVKTTAADELETHATLLVL